MPHLTPKMRFWLALNIAMKERGQPEVLFGDVCAYWKIFQGEF